MTNEEIAIKLTEHSQKIGSLGHRMKDCEEQQKAMNNLVSAVDKLAINMENMLKEQALQGKRISTLEQEPANEFKYYKRIIVSTVISGIIGAVIGAVLTLL